MRRIFGRVRVPDTTTFGRWLRRAPVRLRCASGVSSATRMRAGGFGHPTSAPVELPRPPWAEFPTATRSAGLRGGVTAHLLRPRSDARPQADPDHRRGESRLRGPTGHRSGWVTSIDLTLMRAVPKAGLPRSRHGGLGYGPECKERGPCRPESPPVRFNTPERRWRCTSAAGPRGEDGPAAFDEEDDATQRRVGSNARNRGAVQR